MLAVAAMVGATVSIVGGIGFIGVVVPHLVRLATGPDHRLVLPASALLGVTLLTLSDSLARVIAAPAEVPVGIVTAVIGAPAFVWLLTRMRDPEIRLQPCSGTEADRDRSRPPSFRLRRSCRR
ncbi:hypothetical protein AA12717_0224 [Gluconacetobacter sacchari DSM 12717]|uniref:Iron complex transport system permease protein n=1 Tax=Gluconacetobacter sacchari DSM 12717 TaxID=1307940 RepID=A0ABQ0P2H5_9PROT|nr:hypothetical protein AA12717_0224 [Gluconacetobacter sacchari DSM 12717]